MRLLRCAAVAAAALCVAAALLSVRGAPVGDDGGGTTSSFAPLRSVTSREASTRCSGSSGCLNRWKALFLTGLFVEGVVGGLAPSCLRLLASPDRALHVANAFSGGVFFATGMLHVLPEAVEHLSGEGHGHGEEEHAEEEAAAGAPAGAEGEAEVEGHGEEEEEHSFPTAYALAVGGFYAILFIEHLLLGKAAHSHGAAAVAARAEAAATGGPPPPPLVCAVHPSESSVSLAAGGAEAGGGGKAANGTAASAAGAALLDGGGALPKVPSSTSVRSDASAAPSPASSHEQLLGAENVGFFSPNFTRALLAAFSVSIHSAFESLSLGLADNWSTALNTAIAIAAHKWATAASLGVKFEKERLRRRQVVALVIAWAAVTPVAVGIGMAIDGAVSDTVTGTLFALSAGIFILIGAFEV
ncbi:hypothetical protein BU14_2683s0001, partial [Porphyra umbilicalis]